MASVIVMCPWCDRGVESFGGLMVVHHDVLPVRVCEGSGRQPECAFDGCDSKPFTGRGSDLCYRHKWMEKRAKGVPR